MSGASMKQIKTRIKSVESTRQITKAMELVATGKLRRAKERAEASRPFVEVLEQAIMGLNSAEEPSVYLQEREVCKTCYVVIAGDRGLAGGYNANLFRMVAEHLGSEDVVVPVGKKALEQYQRRGATLFSSYFDVAAAVNMGDCVQLARLLCEGFSGGQFDRVVVAYTEFESILSQIPRMQQLLPLQLEKNGAREENALMEGEDLVDKIVPQYLSGLLYAALCEAAASEHGARRTAMNSANQNAADLIDTLVLRYNRVRQAAITQEITEIVSGAEAL